MQVNLVHVEAASVPLLVVEDLTPPSWQRLLGQRHFGFLFSGINRLLS
jgi:hypothetical protein